MSALDRVTNTIGLVATMRRAGLIAPLRPDKYVRIAAVLRRENMAATSGFASAAQRCPHRPGFIDELGTLTWKQIDERSDGAVAKVSPEPAVFLLDVFVGRVRRKVDANPAKVFETDLHGAVALIQRGIKLRLQTRDESTIDKGKKGFKGVFTVN